MSRSIAVREAGRRRPALRAFLALVLLLVATLAKGQPAQGPRALRLIGNASMPPVIYLEGGQARGVAVDLVEAAAKAAGLDLRVEAMDWQQAQAEVREGRADGLVHINPTPERLRTLAFSAPLLESDFHIFRRRDRAEIRDLASLAGRRVGVERAGFPAQFLAAWPQVQVVTVASWQEAFEQVGRGELDAVFVDRWVGDYALTRIGRTDVEAVEPAVVADHSRIAVARDRAELLVALDRGLAAIERDGTRQAILKRWSGQEVVYLTRQSLGRYTVAAAAAAGVVVLLLILAYTLRLRRVNRSLAVSRDALEQVLKSRNEALRESIQAIERVNELAAEQGAVVNSEVVGFVKVRERVILWVNPAFASMFGYTVDELVGTPTRRLFMDDSDYDEFAVRMHRVRESGQRHRGEVRLTGKDGRPGWYAITVALLERPPGVFLGALVDIRAQRTAVDALRAANEELAALYHESPVGLHSLGPDGTVLRINDTELKWLGRTRDEVVGRTKYVDLLAPESMPLFPQLFPVLQQTGALKDIAIDLIGEDGARIPVLLNARAVYDAEGRFVMTRSTVQNLSVPQRAQAQMEQAQRIARVGSWEIDLATGEIQWSREMKRLFGLDEERPATFDAMVPVLHPDDRAWALNRYQQAIDAGESLHMRCRVVGRGDEVRHLEVIGKCRRDVQGRVTGMVGTAQDVTAELRGALELLHSEQRYEAIVQSQSELICRMRADGTLLLVNPQFCRTFGVDATAVVGQAWQPFALPDDLPRVESRLRELSALNPVVTIENRVRTASQGVRWMEFVNRGFFDENGQLVEIQAVGRDIDARRQLEERLEKALAERLAILDNPLVGIMTSRERRIVWANRAFEDMLGYAHGELTGQPTRIGYASGAEYEAFGAAAYAQLRQGRHPALRQQYVRKDGGRIWVDVSGAALSEPGLTVWVILDVTARKQAEDELEHHRRGLESLVAERTAELAAALEMAQAANRAKSAFLATVSHELRTPMNAILGLTAIVLRRVSDPKSVDYLSKVEGAGHRLLALIDDVLDVTRLEADRLRFESVPFQLADVLARVDLGFGDRAAQRGLSLRVDAPPELLTRRFSGDPMRIEQVLDNLVGNAIKFTERGSIRVSLGATPAPDDRTLLRVEVADTGIGIAAEDQQRIFSVFEQADSSLSRRFGGAGIGLSLCQRLVTAMGGRIGVVSSVGRGSCFWFEVALAAAPAEPTSAASAADDAPPQLRARFAGARVLVVEDDSVNAEVTRLMLEDVGLRVDWAPGGDAALERVVAGRYALILMDLQMPGMDGLAATRAIRALPNGKDVPIAALTARVLDLDRDECAAAGIGEVIAKPVTAAVFYDRILALLDATPAVGH